MTTDQPEVREAQWAATKADYANPDSLVDIGEMYHWANYWHENDRASNWLPIASAPRDGTEILGHDRRGYYICSWNPEQNDSGVSGHTQKSGWVACNGGSPILDEGWDSGSGYTLECSPSHWQPLPQPPEARDDK